MKESLVREKKKGNSRWFYIVRDGPHQGKFILSRLVELDECTIDRFTLKQRLEKLIEGKSPYTTVWEVITATAKKQGSKFSKETFVLSGPMPEQPMNPLTMRWI